jgi:hypothetical protein
MSMLLIEVAKTFVLWKSDRLQLHLYEAQEDHPGQRLLLASAYVRGLPDSDDAAELLGREDRSQRRPRSTQPPCSLAPRLAGPCGVGMPDQAGDARAIEATLRRVFGGMMRYAG